MLSYLQNLDMSNVKVMHLDDWCYMNDSAKAMKICSAEQMHPMTMMPAVATPMTMPMTAAPMTVAPMTMPMTVAPMTMPMTVAPMMAASPMTVVDVAALQNLYTEYGGL